MPSDKEYEAEANEWKQKGNTAFGKSNVEDAVSSYSQGLVLMDRVVALSAEGASIKISLLSNRAACYVKTPKLQECIEDCDAAVLLMDGSSSSEANATATKLRPKILFRRAKARYLQYNMPFNAHNKTEDMLNLAAKDLLQVLSIDSTNKDATILLNTIRSQHAVQSKNKASHSPMGKTLDQLRAATTDNAASATPEDVKKALQSVKVILGLLTNDSSSASMEFGRLKGVQTMLDILQSPPSANAADAGGKDDKTAQDATKMRSLALQCVACAAIHPPFCRQFLPDLQVVICDFILENTATPQGDEDIVIAALAIVLRCILHFDRDDPDLTKEVTGKTLLQYDCIHKALIASFSTQSIKCIRAALDVLSTFIAGSDRQAIIRASLEPGVADIPPAKTQAELRQLNPKQLSDYRARERESRTRDRAWAFERCIQFCEKGGLDVVLRCVIDTAQDDASLRREITVLIGKLFGGMDESERIQKVVGPYLGFRGEADKAKKANAGGDGDDNKLGVVIEELPDDYDEEKDGVETVEDDALALKESGPVTLYRQKERAGIASALLLATPEVGAWAMGQGWPDCRPDLDSLVLSNDKSAMCLAGEVLASAASVKETRPVVATLLTETAMKTLVGHPDRDIRTAAASAIAKIGLAEKGEDEAELLHLLEAACHMLEDAPITQEANSKTDALISKKLDTTSSVANTSIERGIEVMTYLVSKTQMKEELAHGIEASPDSDHTALELLVKVAGEPEAGEALVGFGLASIFQHMAVTIQTLRKESFEGKQVTMEQYDEIQNMQKTDEEKDMEEKKEEYDDTPENCAERIRKMAKGNVPTALVQLMNGASDQTQEQILLAMSRMANEPSVRGTMIQQGVLSALIKIDREEKSPSDQKKKIIRIGRHCLSKLLVTTNPSLLTAAQRLGSIKPLVNLVRDIHAKDLQHFEALMALTNLGASGDDAKNKIITEKGIPSFNFAMFSEHEMVKRAATEAMCNLVPHEKMLLHLREVDTLRLWLALSTDFDDNYECARAAAGGLAMSTQDPAILDVLIELPNFKERMDQLLQSGRPEIMHRVLVILLNLAESGSKYREALEEHGLKAFCEIYIQSYNDGDKAKELGFGEADRNIFNVTIDLAKQIVRECEK